MVAIGEVSRKQPLEQSQRKLTLSRTADTLLACRDGPYLWWTVTWDALTPNVGPVF